MKAWLLPEEFRNLVTINEKYCLEPAGVMPVVTGKEVIVNRERDEPVLGAVVRESLPSS